MGKLGLALVGKALVSKTLIQFCWWVGLHSLPGSCLAWGNPILGSTRSMVGLTVNSRRAYTKGNFHSLLLPVPIPVVSSSDHPSTGSLLTLAGSFGSVSYVVTSPFLWALVYTRFCLCPPRLEPLFPPVLWKSYNQILLAVKARFPGGSQPLCWIPRLGGLMWGSEPWQEWKNIFVTIALQLWVTHPAGAGFDVPA